AACQGQWRQLCKGYAITPGSATRPRSMYRSNIRCNALWPSTTLRTGLLHPTKKSHHLQLLQQHPQRLAAMADGVFLFALQLRTGLAELRQPEQRVVAEAAVAAGLQGDLAVPLALGDQRLRVVGMVQQHQNAVVMRAAISHPAHDLQQLFVVALI